MWAPPPPAPPPPLPLPPATGGPLDVKDSPTPPTPDAVPDTPPPPTPFVDDLNVTTLALISDALPRYPQVAGVRFLLLAADRGPCSAACGAGLAVTSSTCVSTAMHTSAPLEVCQASLSAADARLSTCNSDPCPMDEPHWEVGPWGRSDARCGGGVRSRAVQCMVEGEAATDAAACGLLPLQQYLLSNNAPCVSFAWETTPWSSCSRDCGWGTVRRSASCVSSTGDGIPDMFCAVPAPEVEMECYLRPCDSSLRATARTVQRSAVGRLPSPEAALERDASRPQATLRRLLLDSELEEQELIKCDTVYLHA